MQTNTFWKMEKTITIIINIIIIVKCLLVLLFLQTSSITQNVVVTLRTLDIRNQRWNWQAWTLWLSAKPEMNLRALAYSYESSESFSEWRRCLWWKSIKTRSTCSRNSSQTTHTCGTNWPNLKSENAFLNRSFCTPSKVNRPQKR